ncbi:tRNA (guanine(10)-N(2))-dimethyltransferase, partial [Candidatus Micrarchaeota archaeon CG11_big_fil_rev_8_21_14_0_20_47_5]
MKVKENGITLSVQKGVFFNPNMEICRDICSLAIGAIGKKMDVCDAFCASGVRGIRYKKENKNVGKTHFVDFSERAVECAKKNAKANGMNECSFAKEEVSRFLLCTDSDFQFLEIDPFGSPAPYIFDACRHLSRMGKGERYLSITATDTAVLCGAEHSACVKDYM